MKTHAYVLRAHTNGADNHAKGDVIDLPVTQFQDLKGVELVREATKAEIAAAKKAPEAE